MSRPLARDAGFHFTGPHRNLAKALADALGVPRLGGAVVVFLGLGLSLRGEMLIGSLVAPWAGAVLITVEWLRRRAEDRATGIARPRRPGV